MKLAPDSQANTMAGAPTLLLANSIAATEPKIADMPFVRRTGFIEKCFIGSIIVEYYQGFVN